MAHSSPKLVCRNVWKIFGAHAKEFIASAGGSATPEDLRRKSLVGAVRDVNLEVREGEIFVIMGLSGSGKSTLVRCLSRLVEPTAGEILFSGENLLEANEARMIEIRRHQMGMVFQHFALLPHLTVLGNVTFPLEVQGVGREAREARARKMIELVGLSEKEGFFPRELSGGQQQRVGIARSLAVEPELWFLDEPFSALDPLIRRDMQNEVIRLHRELGKTMVFITHDLAEALKLGDRILILRDGEIIQVGTPDEVVARPADDYVKDFVSEVPKSHVLTLKWVMREPRPRESLDGPALPVDTIVRQAARTAIASEHPIRVMDGDTMLGVVDEEDIMRVVVAEEEAHA